MMLSPQPNLEDTQPEKSLSAEQEDNAEVSDPRTTDLLRFLRYSVRDSAAAPNETLGGYDISNACGNGVMSPFMTLHWKTRPAIDIICPATNLITPS